MSSDYSWGPAWDDQVGKQRKLEQENSELRTENSALKDQVERMMHELGVERAQ